MQSGYTFWKYFGRRAVVGIGAVVIQGVPPAELPVVEDIQGAVSITLSDPQYRTHNTIQGVPPDDLAELNPDHRSIYLPRFPYSGKVSVQGVPPEDVIVVETEEEIRRISIQGYKATYGGKTVIVAIPPEEVAAEDIQGAMSITLNQPPYTGAVFLTPPPIGDDVVAQLDELISSRRSVYTKTYPYGGKTAVTASSLEEGLPDGDINITLSFPPYLGKTIVSTIQLEDVVVVIEAPELHPGIKSIYLPKFPYRGQTTTQSIPPEQTDASQPERRSIYTPIRPYQGESIIQGIPPEQTDASHPDRRSVYTPIRPYAGETFVTLPPVPEIVAEEFDERLQSRVVNLSKYQPLHQGQTFAGNIEREDVIPPPEEVSQGGHFLPKQPGGKKKRKLPVDVFEWEMPQPAPPLELKIPAEPFAGKADSGVPPVAPVRVSPDTHTVPEPKIDMAALKSDIEAELRKQQEKQDEEDLFNLGAFD